MSIDIFKKSFEFKKTTDAKRQVFGVAYPADTIDSQNEFTDTAELELAVQRVAELDGWPRIVDVQHDTQPTASKVIESYIATTDGEYFKKGDWLTRIQLSDSEWGRVESGELTAFSIYGQASRENVTFEGRQVRKMTDIRPSLISLVKKGASQQSFVAKADEKPPKWFRKYMTQLETRINALSKSEENLLAQASPGDYFRNENGWHRVGASNTLYKMDDDMSKRLELAHRQKADKVQKADEQMSEHMHYVDLLHAVVGNSREAMAERNSYASMAARHGGADAVWKGILPNPGGSAYAHRNRGNPFQAALSGGKVPATVAKKYADTPEGQRMKKADEKFLQAMKA